MTQITLPEYNNMAATLSSDSLSVSPAEMHGLLSGMLCGGLDLALNTWMPMLYDYTNDGQGWPIQSQALAATSIVLTAKQLKSDELIFDLLLPINTDNLLDLGDALSEWVNAFIAGIGLVGMTTSSLSKDSKEVLSDLAEIAQLGINEDDNMEEQATLLKQLIEHVSVCAMTLHAELGLIKQNTVADIKPILH